MPKAVNGWKICSKCKEKKPVSEFYKSKRTLDGHQRQCKTCRVAASCAYARTPAGRASQKRYRQSDGGKVVYQVVNARYEQSPRGHEVRLRAGRKRRALEAGAISDLTPEDLAILDARHLVCAYCGRAFIAGHPLYKRTVDHIVPLSRGGQHTLDNLVFAHKRCNSQKGDKLLEEWVDRWYEQEVRLCHMR